MESNGKFTIVDPGDPKPVHDYIKETGLELSEILLTHHHWDHSGGVEELKFFDSSTMVPMVMGKQYLAKF